MGRLTPGMTAPRFAVESAGGEPIALEALRGRPVLLKFSRFAGCPICVLHLRELVKRHAELEAVGLRTIVCFPSPEDRVRRKHGRTLPFDMIADDERRIYDAYGVERSVGGALAGATGKPADFIVGADGLIRFAHYGSNYADTLGVDSVLGIVAGLGIHGTPEGREDVVGTA